MNLKIDWNRVLPMVRGLLHSERGLGEDSIKYIEDNPQVHDLTCNFFNIKQVLRELYWLNIQTVKYLEIIKAGEKYD